MTLTFRTPLPDYYAHLRSITAVQHLHRECDCTHYADPHCSAWHIHACAYTYPCPTIHALNGAPSQLEHADDCDRARGCTCGTRTIAHPQEEQE